MDTKLWWQSRTIWVQIVAAAFAVLAVFHVLPAGIDQGQVVGAIMLVVAAASAALRVRTTTAIAPTAAQASAPGDRFYRVVNKLPPADEDDPLSRPAPNSFWFRGRWVTPSPSQSSGRDAAAAAPSESAEPEPLLSPSPPVEPAPDLPQPDQPQEPTPMSLKTFLIEAEEAAVDTLKNAGTVLKSVVVSDVQKAVAELKQTNVGTTALNLISALENHSATGAEKMASLVGAIVPLVGAIISGGGFSGLLVTVEDLALELGQSLFNDFKAGVAKVAAEHAPA